MGQASQPTAGRLDGLFVDDLESDAGPGAPLVVLVHGTMDRHSSFARVRARLMATCHVVSYDRRGYAGSRDAEPPAASIADHVDDLEALCDGRRATLVGHSYGADVCLALAERRPELAGAVVAYEAPLWWLDWWPRRSDGAAPFSGLAPNEAAAEFLRRMVGAHRYDRLPLRTREEAERDGEALLAEMGAIASDGPVFDPVAVTAPVLVAYGSDTEDYHRRGAEWLAAELPAGSLHAVEGAAHIGHQSHPAEFARLALAGVALSGDPEASRPPAEL